MKTRTHGQASATSGDISVLEVDINIPLRDRDEISHPVMSDAALNSALRVQVNRHAANQERRWL